MIKMYGCMPDHLGYMYIDCYGKAGWQTKTVKQDLAIG